MSSSSFADSGSKLPGKGEEEKPETIGKIRLKWPHDVNLQFYRGQVVSEPHGATIDDMLSWHDDLYTLEMFHGYMQWLFPISESGSANSFSQPLKPCEAAVMRKDKGVMKRFFSAYVMMLNFYGMRIVGTDTGRLARNEHWQERFMNLNHSIHNHVRVTRILKSLGELGLEHFQFSFVKFLMKEALVTGELSETLTSCQDFWIDTVKDVSERNILKNWLLEFTAPTKPKLGLERTNPRTVALGDEREPAVVTELDRRQVQEVPKEKFTTKPKDPPGRQYSDPATDRYPRLDQEGNPDKYSLPAIMVHPPSQSSPAPRRVYYVYRTDYQSYRETLAAERVANIADVCQLTQKMDAIATELSRVSAERSEQTPSESAEKIMEMRTLMTEMKRTWQVLSGLGPDLESLLIKEGNTIDEMLAKSKNTRQTTEQATAEVRNSVTKDSSPLEASDYQTSLTAERGREQAAVEVPSCLASPETNPEHPVNLKRSSETEERNMSSAEGGTREAEAKDVSSRIHGNQLTNWEQRSTTGGWNLSSTAEAEDGDFQSELHSSGTKQVPLMKQQAGKNTITVSEGENLGAEKSSIKKPDVGSDLGSPESDQGNLMKEHHIPTRERNLSAVKREDSELDGFSLMTADLLRFSESKQGYLFNGASNETEKSLSSSDWRDPEADVVTLVDGDSKSCLSSRMTDQGHHWTDQNRLTREKYLSSPEVEDPGTEESSLATEDMRLCLTPSETKTGHQSNARNGQSRERSRPSKDRRSQGAEDFSFSKEIELNNDSLSGEEESELPSEDRTDPV